MTKTTVGKEAWVPNATGELPAPFQTPHYMTEKETLLSLKPL